MIYDKRNKPAENTAGRKENRLDMDIIAHKTPKDDITRFFTDLWRGCDGDIYLWTKSQKGLSHTEWGKITPQGLTRAAEYAIAEGQKHDVYFGISTTSRAKASKRGTAARAKAEEVQEVPALWADIDIKSKETQGHHANKKNYAKSIDPWKKKVFSIYPPTYLIKTGGGYHAYWLLKEPFKVQDDESRKQIQETVEKFQACIAGLAGYQIDQTADLARVLRVPGTMNHKTPDELKPVEIVEHKAIRYALDDIPVGEIPAQEAKEPLQPRPQEKKDRRNGKLTPLEKCMRGRSAPIFKAIYGGDISGYSSLSEAVQAMANIAAPRCDNDFKAMLEIFQSSPLWGMIEAKHGKGEKAEKWLERSFNKAQDAVPQKTAGNTSPTDPEVFAVKYPDWRFNAKGDAIPIANSFRNVMQVVGCAGITIKLNLLKKQVEYDGGLGNGFPNVKDMTPDGLTNYIRLLCQKNGLNVSKVDCESALQTIAEEHKYNPVQDWLKAARAAYDGGDYLERTYQRLHLRAGQDEELCQILFRKWFISAVRIAFNDGTYSAPGMLVLSGPQGCGKTRFVQMLAPNREWVADGLSINPAEKDTVLNATRYWLVELGEIGQTLRKERKDRLKAFFTQATDTIRKHYGRTAEELPRRTCFIGTVNEELDDGFLTDPTGSRRYWPIEVESVDLPPEDIQPFQLWGQVMAIAEKESAYLTPDEAARLARHNVKHDKKTQEEIILLDKLDWKASEKCWRWARAADIMEELEIRRDRVGYVGRAIRHIAQTDSRVKVPKNNMDRRYFLPEVRGYNNFENPENGQPPFSVLNGGKS